MHLIDYGDRTATFGSSEKDREVAIGALNLLGVKASIKGIEKIFNGDLDNYPETTYKGMVYSVRGDILSIDW